MPGLMTTEKKKMPHNYRAQTWNVDDLRVLGKDYHGDRGDFAYAAYTWLNRQVFGEELPTTLFQWALTPWGKCIGLTRSDRELERPPVITIHPAAWQSHRTGTGWSKSVPSGPRYALDVVLHELIHVEVDYLRGGMHGKSSHDCPEWCEAIMRAAKKLKGTPLEVSEFKAAPTKRIWEGRRQRRRTPPGCISMAAISKFPHSLRSYPHYGARSVPFVYSVTEQRHRA